MKTSNTSPPGRYPAAPPPQMPGDSPASQTLRELAAIGPRLTGSKGEQRATHWAIQRMREIGLVSVHAEPWTLDRGWTRGHATARLITGDPASQLVNTRAGGRPLAAGPGNNSTDDAPATLDVLSFGWTGSTKGLVEGSLISVAPTKTTDTKDWRGKVLLVQSSSDSLTSFFALPTLVHRAEQAGALAVLVADDRPGSAHASPLSFPGQPSSLPVLNLAQNDAARLAALLAGPARNNAPPRLQLDVSNTFTPGPILAHNVIGEIPAAPGPDAPQTVLLAAHLDSWDLSPGASDDAYGVATVLGAAQAITASGIRPRRTIRITLFTGEEQGLLGSRAYVRSHATELDNLVCALVMDWGSGPITKLPLAGHPELHQPLQRILNQAPPTSAVTLSSGYLTYTDAFSFTAAGVAGLALLQDSPDYDRIGHSVGDTLENIQSGTLDANVSILSALTLGLANAPERPARRWTPAQRDAEMTRIHTPAGLLSPDPAVAPRKRRALLQERKGS